MAREVILLAADIAGLGAIAYGFWLFWHPAAFIVPGAIVIALSVVADLKRAA